MLSQSLLFWLWRDWAAPPDSSASSHAETTLGSRPVSAARREANCCWSEVSRDCALDGSAPPVLGICVEPTSWAWASALAKLEDEPVSADEVPVTLEDEVAAATEGSKAVWRDWICA